YFNSLGSLLRANYPAWSVSLNFSYPLGTNTAEAAVARARIQVNQTDAQIRQIELQVATDVTTAAVTVQSNTQSVQPAPVAGERACLGPAAPCSHEAGSHRSAHRGRYRGGCGRVLHPSRRTGCPGGHLRDHPRRHC